MEDPNGASDQLHECLACNSVGPTQTVVFEDVLAAALAQGQTLQQVLRGLVYHHRIALATLEQAIRQRNRRVGEQGSRQAVRQSISDVRLLRAWHSKILGMIQREALARAH